MNIRAKMVCEGVSKTGDSENVALRAVTSGSEENKTFAKYTPSAYVQLTIDNPSAQGAFEQGKEYFVDFSPAE